ncbi:unnamed protein product [Phytophthora fragariaefolia]|uniref:Unnamed protein product n=1 Tax=Phytophthora fragariaefolia TaxID=1490495 RepID=A0A9W6YBL0_9STRA|nr:unnamed protein product [Phytophthora fragariaefolia]
MTDLAARGVRATQVVDEAVKQHHVTALVKAVPLVVGQTFASLAEGTGIPPTSLGRYQKIEWLRRAARGVRATQVADEAVKQHHVTALVKAVPLVVGQTFASLAEGTGIPPTSLGRYQKIEWLRRAARGVRATQVADEAVKQHHVSNRTA